MEPRPDGGAGRDLCIAIIIFLRLLEFQLALRLSLLFEVLGGGPVDHGGRNLFPFVAFGAQVAYAVAAHLPPAGQLIAAILQHQALGGLRLRRAVSQQQKAKPNQQHDLESPIHAFQLASRFYRNFAATGGLPNPAFPFIIGRAPLWTLTERAEFVRGGASLLEQGCCTIPLKSQRSGMSAKYIFVTGGVVSSLGKGLAAASIGCLLEAAD